MIKLFENDKKLKELILYLSLLSESDEYFGATKLNKLLFFSDFLAYLNFGEAITGQEYQKLPQGPAPRRLLPIREEMLRDNDIKFASRDFYGYEQQRIIPIREPDLSIFTPQEIDLVNRVVDEFKETNGTQISEKSHLFAGWKYAEFNEKIPYEVALVGHRDLTPEEIEYGIQLEEKAKELV